jgi:hypothetical protein
MFWPQVGLPEHCRSACRAKMRSDLSSFLPITDIDFGGSFGANMFLLEVGTDAEHRTGSPHSPQWQATTASGSADTSTRKAPQEAMRSSRHSTLRHQVGRDYRRAGVRATLSLLTAFCPCAGAPRLAETRKRIGRLNTGGREGFEPSVSGAIFQPNSVTSSPRRPRTHSMHARPAQRPSGKVVILCDERLRAMGRAYTA